MRKLTDENKEFCIGAVVARKVDILGVLSIIAHVFYEVQVSNCVSITRKVKGIKVKKKDMVYLLMV